MSSLLAAVNVGDSVQTALDSFFGFLPKLIGFIIVLAIGWIVGGVSLGLEAASRCVRQVGATPVASAR